jgi:hypothetical protein
MQQIREYIALASEEASLPNKERGESIEQPTRQQVTQNTIIVISRVHIVCIV